MIAIVGLGILGTRVLKLIDPAEEVLLIDYDFVLPENIPRQYPKQVLHKSKVEAARVLYHEKAEVVHGHLDLASVGILEEASVVIDCTDNILARRIINDFCSKEGIPWIHTAMSDTAATVAVFVPEGPCFNCVYPRIVGETCSPALDIRIADRAAAAVMAELQKKRLVPVFIRITQSGSSVLDISRRKDCLTCNGIYEYLHPKGFYITYCENAECMAAKPFRHLHDHGKPQELVVKGMYLELFPNGEIHFHSEAEDDTLYDIAAEVYAKYHN